MTRLLMWYWHLNNFYICQHYYGIMWSLQLYHTPVPVPVPMRCFCFSMNIFTSQALHKMVSVIQMHFGNISISKLTIFQPHSYQLHKKKSAISVLLSKREPFSLIFRSHKGISVPLINSIHGLTGEQWHGHPALDSYSTFCSLEFMKLHRPKSRTNTHTANKKKSAKEKDAL